MNGIAIANIETLDAERFLAVNLYGSDGYLVDQIIVPFTSYTDAIERILALAKEHDESSLELWTSSRDLFGLTLSTPGLAGRIKHANETRETARIIAGYDEILRDLHGVESLSPLPKLPKWRKTIYLWLESLTNYVKGDGKYEI